MKRLGTLILILLALPYFVQAQEEATNENSATVETQSTEDTTEASTSSETSAPKSGNVEKIEVTGSHIKRIDVEGPSPVLTLDRDYLTRTGFNNVGDVLRETTVATFGGTREASLSGGANTGASTTSLRGFGADRILVLLDGKRLPNIGGSSSVDLSLIPMAAVERIEVLKDGASAIYGSDALGGVINIITKREYDGSSVELGYTTPESRGGTRKDVKASYGKTFSKGDFLGVFQYRSNQATWSRDYDFARPTSEWFSYSSSPGTWVDSGGTHAGSAADPCPSDRVAPDGTCLFDYSPYSQVTPQIDQYSSLLSGHYEINETLKSFARVMYVRRETGSQLAPAPDSFRDDTATGGLNTQISQATATAWGLPAASDLNIVRYRLVDEGGSRKTKGITNSFAVQTGVNGYLADTWEWELSGTYGSSSNKSTSFAGYYNKQILYNMANANTFNPFAAPNAKSDISAASYQPVTTTASSTSTVNLKASGELMDLPAGPLALAVGIADAWQTYDQTSDAITQSGAQWGGGGNATGSGNRNFHSAYTEFSLPPIKDMELQVAGRFDQYSDFGSTFNPKVGFRYNLLKGFMLRGSWGTGFRAPALSDLYQAQSTSYIFGTDPITGQKAQFETLTGGNLNLKQETTNSVNVGFVAELLKGLSLVVDYWETQQDNVVTLATNRNLFRAEQAFGNSYLQQFGIDIIRDSGTNKIQRIINPNVNLASKKINGLDAQLNYMQKLVSDYNFRFGVNFSYLFKYMVQPFPGLSFENQVGFAGVPYWKNNVTLGVGNHKYDYSATVRTIGETNFSALDANPGRFGKTRDQTELDLRFQYTSSWDGVFSVMVRNVFNTKRPYYMEYLSSGYLDTSLYDPFGRAVGVNYRQTF